MRSVSKKQQARNREYTKVRKLVYERDGGLCVLCGAMATDTHHIIFRSHGGPDTLENLVCLCRECHNLAHGVQAKEVRKVLIEKVIR